MIVAHAVIKLSGFEASVFLTTKFRGFLIFFFTWNCVNSLSGFMHIAQ